MLEEFEVIEATLSLWWKLIINHHCYKSEIRFDYELVERVWSNFLLLQASRNFKRNFFKPDVRNFATFCQINLFLTEMTGSKSMEITNFAPNYYCLKIRLEHFIITKIFIRISTWENWTKVPANQRANNFYVYWKIIQILFHIRACNEPWIQSIKIILICTCQWNAYCNSISTIGYRQGSKLVV